MKWIKKIPTDRKLWICVIMFITSIIFVFTNNVNFEQWAQFIKYTFLIFSGTMALDTINKKDRKNSNWKSRKLWMFFFFYFISVTMVIMNFAMFDQWSQFVNWLYGIYATSNVGTSYVNSKTNKTKKFLNQ